jgi:hypothetical protein
MLISPALHSEADACLSWAFDAHLGPKAISPEGSQGARVGGCFLLLLGGLEQNEVRIAEDGFSLTMTQSTATIFWECLTQKRNMHLPTTGDTQEFSMIWE